MLTESRPGGPFMATCDKCRASLPLDVGTHDAGRLALTEFGWMEAAQKGRPRERWAWWCPACVPKKNTSWGRTTP